MQWEIFRNIIVDKMVSFLDIFAMEFMFYINLISFVISTHTVRHTRVTKNFNVFKYTNQSFTHAESPAWDPATSTLYWVDVLNQNVYALDYNTNKHKMKHICYGEVNIILPVANSKRVLVGVRSEVYLLDWDKPGDRGLRLVAALDQGSPDNILNEGNVDAFGRFWGGTKGTQIGDKVVPDRGALYSLEGPHFQPRLRLMPVSISNGLVWSPNNSVLYYIDSGTRKIEAFDFDLEEGHLNRRRAILDIDEYSENTAIADGMTIDIDGFLWVALMFEGSVIRIDPDKRSIVEKYNLPVSRVTSVTWAGTELTDLIVTTSRRNMDLTTLSEQPLSGSIFIMHDLGTRGMPDNKFLFPDADTY